MIFPYIEFLGLAEERIFRPMIPLTLKVGKQVFKSFALIDSGSDYTILPIQIAGIFNLKLDDQPNYTVQGAGGNSFKIYKSPIEIECLLQNRAFRDIKWSSHVYFSESETALLLGQKGCLDKLKVKLNGQGKEVEIQLS
ncbi:MAG: hypothetical protein WC846_00410 [Candidatus Gracilibacteria bacterium]|jgi:predicted aspartyl protease